MEELLAYVGAELKRPEAEISDEIVFLINSRIKPPKPVAKDDIFVRTMFLVSDEVNSYGGRFPLEELFNIANLVIDSPVMVGHTKEKLPIARNFKAEVAQKDGKNWLKVWFYWLKSAKDASSLKENIDHGIYKECSLGFLFEFPQCSICGEDMRRCHHVPFKSYQTEKGQGARVKEERVAYFNYRNITRVLETSLVYRGAVPNTSMSDELWLYQKRNSEKRCGDLDSGSRSNSGRIYGDVVEKALKRAGLSDKVKLVGGVLDKGYSDHDVDLVCPPHLEVLVLGALPTSLRSRVHFVQDVSEKPPKVTPFIFIPPTKPKKSSSSSNEIFHLEDLSTLSGEFLIEPKYDGVRVQIHRKKEEVRICTDEGNRIEQKFPHLVKDILSNPQRNFILDGELVKYKGNSRLSHKDVGGYIHQKPDGSSSKRNEAPDDSHFRFKLFDLLYLNGEDRTSFPLEQRKKLLEDLFQDTNFIQKVKYERILSSNLLSKIKGIATSEGAMIKKTGSGYFDEESWYKWKRYFELDVLVMGVEKNKGGSYNYTCAVGTKANPIPVGSTYSTSIQAKPGDIIRVRVDYVTRVDDRFTWYAPRVLDKRSDRKEPDPISVLERMIDEKKSAVGRPPTATKNPEAVDSGLVLSEVEGRRSVDRFVLQLHWWGKAKHHDLRFQKGKVAIGLTIFELDLDGLNRGKRFLCEWKDYHDPKWMEFEGDIPPEEGGTEGNPSKNLVAHMKILDKGKYRILERKTDFSSFKIEGKVLNGIYLVRKVRLKGKDRWLFWKRSTDGTDGSTDKTD
ncbi:MAG: ATP-dependent DNA ligase [candidate division Zixibacteria bacterium]|nr:ATP-dependent DNA ligase [candidate division Zixibacteria bacterium]